jgi:hypothetical protein
MENLTPLLFVGGAGMILTILVLVTGKTKFPPEEIQHKYDALTIFSVTIAIIPLIYLTRLALMFLTGILSGFILQATIGTLIALLPLLIIFFFRIQKKQYPKGP